MSSVLPKLNFPPIKLRATERDGQFLVWNELRRCNIVLTPEEWVRRHVVGFLLSSCQIGGERIIEEYPILLNGQNQRADIVVVDNSGLPLMLIECKAPEVKISQQTFDQAIRYNSVASARYIVLTNGLKHYSYVLTEAGYSPLSHFPLSHCPQEP
ncbi:MAG: type I restriction enzyme HsdR N-terminal domain-containing protein [Rikenellaceae bacterium]